MSRIGDDGSVAPPRPFATGHTERCLKRLSRSCTCHIPDGDPVLDTKNPAPSERCAKCGHTRFYAQPNGTCGYVDSEGGCECGRSHDAPAPLADGGEILTREEYERTWAHIREFLRQRGDYPAVGSSALAALDKGDAALRARVAELERVIEEAPHGFGPDGPCSSAIGTKHYDESRCDCWKSKAKRGKVSG